MKQILLSFVLVIGLTSAALANDKQLTVEDAQRASNETIQQLLNTIQQLKNGSSTYGELDSFLSGELAPSALRRDHCDEEEEDERTNCVPNCTGRSSDGSCYLYGDDYCGPGASCAPNCIGRSSNGQCYLYGDDYCGENVYCAPNCTGRSSNGECYLYGDDVCY